MILTSIYYSINSRVKGTFGRALLYECELTPSFPLQTMLIVFYGRNLDMMKTSVVYLDHLIFVLLLRCKVESK